MLCWFEVEMGEFDGGSNLVQFLNHSHTSTLFQHLQIHKNSQIQQKHNSFHTYTEHTVRLDICHETKKRRKWEEKVEESRMTEYVFVCI